MAGTGARARRKEKRSSIPRPARTPSAVIADSLRRNVGTAGETATQILRSLRAAGYVLVLKK